jgi:hypothetical protein
MLGLGPFALSLSKPVLSEAEGRHTHGNPALNSPGSVPSTRNGLRGGSYGPPSASGTKPCRKVFSLTTRVHRNCFR